MSLIPPTNCKGVPGNNSSCSLAHNIRLFISYVLPSGDCIIQLFAIAFVSNLPELGLFSAASCASNKLFEDAPTFPLFALSILSHSLLHVSFPDEGLAGNFFPQITQVFIF